MTPLQQTGFPDLQLLTRCSAKDFLWLYPPLQYNYFLFLPQLLPTAYPTRCTATCLSQVNQALYLVMHLLGSYPVPLPLPLSEELATTPPASGYWLLTDARACPRPRANTPVYASCISGYEAGATGVLRLWGHESVLRRLLHF